MHIATLGDVMLDIIVDAPTGLRTDDDTEACIDIATGGQAANVAAWAVALGARATLIGPRGRGHSAAIVDEQLAAAGVAVMGVDVASTGKVVSILAGGARTLASDAGDQGWLDRLEAAHLPDEVDWLHVSGYPLLRAEDPRLLLGFVDDVRRSGASVSLDLSSAGLLAAYGPRRFGQVLARLSPRLVFANASEWEELGLDSSRVTFDLVIKRGPDGVTTVVDGLETSYAAMSTEVVDLTGAGDALAAGYLVGGVDLALAAAARCVGLRGAQPQGQPPVH
jgi:ribokinase